MTEIDVEVGPLDLRGIARAFATWPAMSPPLLDMPQSIRLARAAQFSANSLESDISLTWVQGESPIAYAPICLRRSTDGLIVLQGMPNPLRLPALLPSLHEQARRNILDSFRDHLISALARTHQATLQVWVPISGQLPQGSIEARWLSAVPTVGAGVGLDIELGVSPEHCWSGLRKCYRSLINKGRRALSASVLTQGNVASEISLGVAELARLHREAAGRVVYDARLWDVVLDLVREGSAACVLVHADVQAVGAILLLLEGRRSSYAMGAFDRDLMTQGLPVGHTALWAAINWLGEEGFTRLHLGTSPTPPPAEGKEAGIDHFKRGFATVLSPWLVTELEATHSPNAGTSPAGMSDGTPRA